MDKKELATKEMRISELRALDITEENKDMIVEGYAAVFETETDLGWCKEIISRDAFISARGSRASHLVHRRSLNVSEVRHSVCETSTESFSIPGSVVQLGENAFGIARVC